MKDIRPAEIDVFLLAAGFGKRLLPLTERVPKPMLPLAGRPIIDYALHLIARSGFQRVFINLHHLGEIIRTHVGNGSSFGLEVEYSEEPVILDTGGGIKQIESRLRSEWLVTLNSDTIFGPEFRLDGLLQAHAENRALATLLLREDVNAERYGIVGVNSHGKVVEFLGRKYGEPATRRLMYTGAQVLSRELFSFMPNAGSIFSITRDTYRKVLELKGALGSLVYDGYWSDLGTPALLADASKMVEERYSPFAR